MIQILKAYMYTTSIYLDFILDKYIWSFKTPLYIYCKRCDLMKVLCLFDEPDPRQSYILLFQHTRCCLLNNN